MKRQADNEIDLKKDVDAVIFERHTPAAVVVNEELEILQFRGQTSKYLEHSSGKASFNLIKMLRRELIPHVHSAIRKAKKLGAAVKTPYVRVKNQGLVCEISAEVVPLKPLNTKSSYFIIFFNEEGSYQEAGARGKIKSKERICPSGRVIFTLFRA